jgi:streptomycin 6-kinase
MSAPHPGLSWAEKTAEGRAWLERLPQLTEECAAHWELELGPPFPYAYASLAAPARRPDGAEAVLKICFPHRESEHEGDALALWAGNGAVRLLAHDRERWALLLERCRPGTSLGEMDADAALEVFAALLPRLWVPADEPFRPLAEESGWWAESLEGSWERAGRPFDRKLLDAALEALAELPVSHGEQVLLHQDLHAGNVLRAEREPWLVIDPKPLVGEREFSLAPIIRSVELGHSELAVRSASTTSAASSASTANASAVGRSRRPSLGPSTASTCRPTARRHAGCWTPRTASRGTHQIRRPRSGARSRGHAAP